MPITRLYVVRHGATQLTAEGRFSGDAGAELSDEGRWQAAQLGERLRGEGITAAYCLTLCAFAERVAARVKAHRRLARLLSRLTGVLLIGFGLRLLRN